MFHKSRAAWQCDKFKKKSRTDLKARFENPRLRNN
jgi:hypothetical protein